MQVWNRYEEKVSNHGGKMIVEPSVRNGSSEKTNYSQDVFVTRLEVII